jgi:predicted transcriptional regulator
MTELDRPLKDRDVMLKTFTTVKERIRVEPNRLFSRRELAKELGVDHWSIVKICNELRDEGFATEFRQGDRRFYRLKKKGEAKWVENHEVQKNASDADHKKASGEGRRVKKPKADSSAARNAEQ